jgi:hypothetical protein
MAHKGDDWTDDEEHTLTSNWNSMSAGEIAGMLPGRTESAVYSKAYRMKEKGRLSSTGTASTSTDEAAHQTPGFVENMGDVYWRENKRSSMRSGFLPMTVDGEEIEVPVRNADVLEVPTGADAEGVYIFENELLVDYGTIDGYDYEMRYSPYSEDWTVSSVRAEEVEDASSKEAVSEHTLWQNR